MHEIFRRNKYCFLFNLGILLFQEFYFFLLSLGNLMLEFFSSLKIQVQKTNFKQGCLFYFLLKLYSMVILIKKLFTLVIEYLLRFRFFLGSSCSTSLLKLLKMDSAGIQSRETSDQAALVMESPPEKEAVTEGWRDAINKVIAAVMVLHVGPSTSNFLIRDRHWVCC